MRSKIAHTTLEKTFEEQDTLNQAARAWNIECLWYSRDHLSRLDQAAMEMLAEAEHIISAKSLQK